MSFEIDLIEQAESSVEAEVASDSPTESASRSFGVTSIMEILAEVERLRAANRPPDPAPIELLGRYARRGRGIRALTQDELSAKTGISQSAISRFELGTGGGMPVERLLLIGGELGNAFPLGVCPHQHRCALQPYRPPAPLTEQELIREQHVALGLGPRF